jgi:hypothetical protein
LSWNHIKTQIIPCHGLNDKDWDNISSNPEVTVDIYRTEKLLNLYYIIDFDRRIYDQNHPDLKIIMDNEDLPWRWEAVTNCFLKIPWSLYVRLPDINLLCFGRGRSRVFPRDM